MRGRFAAYTAVERGIAVPNFAQRIRCYQCYIALNALPFFAQQQNDDGTHKPLPIRFPNPSHDPVSTFLPTLSAIPCAAVVGLLE